jgi:hypothetical protein
LVLMARDAQSNAGVGVLEGGANATVRTRLCCVLSWKFALADGRRRWFGSRMSTPPMTRLSRAGWEIGVRPMRYRGLAGF